MKQKKFYSIGDMSSICNISKKALRYYDEIGLIPSERKELNNYRCYNRASLLAVPVIKYYKQMGFRLDEINKFIEGNVENVYRVMQRSFKDKIEELEKQQEEIRRKYESVKDWYSLVQEAEMVLDHDIRDVSIRYVNAQQLLCMNQQFEGDIEEYIINIEFTNFVESVNNEITGPVIILFSSHQDRIKEINQPIRMLQRTLMPIAEEHTYHFGGQLMITCYHHGSHDTIQDTYRKMIQWAKSRGYELARESYERYVTDYWTTRNAAQFVTEIMIRAHRQGIVGTVIH